MLRIKGELVLLEQGHDTGVGEENLAYALVEARRQGTLSWELRAAISLAWLRRAQGRSTAARELLEPVFDRVSEGFATTESQVGRSSMNCASEVDAIVERLRRFAGACCIPPAIERKFIVHRPSMSHLTE